MLAAGGGLTYANEPLSVSHRQGVLGVEIKHWYTYINEENEAQYLAAFQDLLALRYQLTREIRALRSSKDVVRMGRDAFNFMAGSLRGWQVLLKDPFASFSMPWFARRLNCQIVAVVRHPAGFAGSLKRLGWPFQIEDLLAQPLLMRDHLEQDRPALEAVAADDVIGRAGLLWKVLYRHVHQTVSQNPDFISVRHDDLSRDPVSEFQKLYQKLGYRFTPKVENAILKSSSSKNPTHLAKNRTHATKLDSRANLNHWKAILTPQEVTRIRKMTEEVSCLYYSDDEW
jgi:hypothetical protein